MPRVIAKKSERMSPEGALLADLREMIARARAQVARAADSTLVMLYWHMGQRIREDILKQKRAAYGEEIVATLAQQLTSEFARGYSRYNLSRMVQFAEAFPERRIVVTLSQQLGWSHFVKLLAPAGHSRLLDLEASGIRVASYWTEDLPKEQLERKLHEAVILARERLRASDEPRPLKGRVE